MSRSLILSIALFSTLAGCATPQSAKELSTDEAQGIVDRQILDAGLRIQRSQAELFQTAALSTFVPPMPANIRDDGQPVTLIWKGDAAELLAELAKARGLGLVTAGVKLPLPVNLAVKGEPFSGVLQLLRAQIGYRATVRQEGDRIVIAYNQPHQ